MSVVVSSQSKENGVMSTQALRVVPVGIGEMGKKLCLTILKKDGVEIVAACDQDPTIAGKDLGEILGLSEKLGITVEKSVNEVFKNVKADVGLFCTVTGLDELYPMVLPALEAGCDVISTSEVLSYPFRKDAEYAAKLDAASKKYGVSILGSGVYPGFLPDAIPIIATAGCRDIEHIDIKAFGDVYPYGPTVWKGMGLGLTVEEYQQQFGKEVDIEFTEPLEQVIAAIGLQLDEIREDNQCLIARHHIKVGGLEVEKGTVCGFSQTTTGFIGGRELIRQNIVGDLCSELPPFWVEVNISGKPDVKLRLDLVHEDGWVTSTMLVNMIPKVMKAHPGFVAMKDLQLPSAEMGDMRRFLA
jgi:2,4-diaminopentanoate dehydrogenase